MYKDMRCPHDTLTLMEFAICTQPRQHHQVNVLIISFLFKRGAGGTKLPVVQKEQILSLFSVK